MTTTDVDGGYSFTDVVAGTYVVRVNTNVSSIDASLSANPTYDEDDGTAVPDHETSVTVSVGDEYVSADFGYNYASVAETNTPESVGTPLGAIGDRIWSTSERPTDERLRHRGTMLVRRCRVRRRVVLL